MKHEHSMYGFFPGGDPRRFSPDGEGSTPQEIEAHRAACEAWGAAETAGQILPPLDAACRMIPGVGHINHGTFGLGVYTYDCDDPECPEAQEPPDDPTDAHAAFARWWVADGSMLEAEHAHNGETVETLMRQAFVAGFRAHEEAEEVT